MQASVAERRVAGPSVFGSRVRIRSWREKRSNRRVRSPELLSLQEINRFRIGTRFWRRWHEGEAKLVDIPERQIAGARLIACNDWAWALNEEAVMAARL